MASRIGLPLAILSVLAIVLLGAPARAYDSEWPPLPDPTPGHPELQFGTIDIPLPPEIGGWLNHRHISSAPGPGEWGNGSLMVRIGDVNGVDDGELCAVVYVSNEMLAAFRLDIDWTAQPPTAAATPLWAMLTPYAKRPLPDDNGLGGVPPADFPDHYGRDPRNVAIWDFVDDDHTNEIAFIYCDNPKAYPLDMANSYLYVVRPYAPGTEPPPSEWDFPGLCPPPQILATRRSDGSFPIDDRVGITRVRDTQRDGAPYPRDICTYGHTSPYLSLFEVRNTGGAYSIEPLFMHRGGYWGPSGTISHAYNHLDIDGDGYEEFFMDGVVDFMNPDGPTAYPHQAWRTGSTGAADDHHDSFLAADFDWDPANGYELVSTPSVGWTSECDGQSRENKVVVWNQDGTLRDANEDGLFYHGQGGTAGNWTASRTGLEMIFFPKDLRVAPQGNFWGSIAIDANTRELVCDGMIDPDGTGMRNGGPAGGVVQIDWDGDYTEDEMLSLYGALVQVWRMGEKGDWGATPPPGMPADRNASLAGWWQGGQQRFWYWYKDISMSGHDPAWENGGAGLFTHYYEKLAEASPAAWAFFAGDAYDLGRDYREEILVARKNYLTIYYNPEPLSTPGLHPSPTQSLAYRQHRQEYECYRTPFRYDQQPTLAGVQVAQQSVDLETGGTATVTVLGHNGDGVTWDITSVCSWTVEPSGSGLYVGPDGVIHAGDVDGVYTLVATTPGPGGPVQSAPITVTVTTSDIALPALAVPVFE